MTILGFRLQGDDLLKRWDFMAIIWSRTIESNHYEVRSAGATLRLYRNGVHHSQYNPSRPLGGSIWDLLVLPALHFPKGFVRDALILGFGAGAAGRVMQELMEPEQVVGVELDPIHLSIAEGFFECSQGCELVAGDAVEWVESESAEGPQYDYILDDLYAEADGLPVRCAPFDLNWFQRLAAMVRPGGMLVFNTVEPDKVPHLAIMIDPELRARFQHVRSYRLDGYENRVVAFCESPLDCAQLDLNLREVIRRFPRCSGVKKRYLVEDFSVAN